MPIFSFTFSIFCPSVNASSAETSYIYKDASDNSMQCRNISSYSGKKIGVVKNSMMSSYLNTQFNKTHAKADVIYYDDFSDCSSDFYKKKIDAFVSADNIVSSYTGVFPVEKLGKEPYYLAVAKGHKNLLNELNMSLSVIDGQDGLFLNELKNKYSSDTGVGMNETTVTIILPFTIANAQENSSAYGNGNADHLNNDEFTSLLLERV